MTEGKNMGGFDAQERRPQPGADVAATLAAAALNRLQNMTASEKLAFATVEAAALYATETEASLITMDPLLCAMGA